jgi:CheY-like chemotaxis protein
MQTACSFCVIIVDDDADDRFLVEQAFRQANPECQIQLFDNGGELLKHLASWSSLPSLIVLDLNMPQLNGFETLQAIRQVYPPDELPVVILTTTAEVVDQQRAFQLQANAFITKPVTLGGYREVMLGLRRGWLEGRCQPLTVVD